MYCQQFANYFHCDHHCWSKDFQCNFGEHLCRLQKLVGHQNDYKETKLANHFIRLYGGHNSTYKILQNIAKNRSQKSYFNRARFATALVRMVSHLNPFIYYISKYCTLYFDAGYTFLSMCKTISSDITVKKSYVCLFTFLLVGQVLFRTKLSRFSQIGMNVCLDLKDFSNFTLFACCCSFHRSFSNPKKLLQHIETTYRMERKSGHE